MIQQGDKVKVSFGGDIFFARVINMPRGAGDLLQIERDEDGVELAINPYHSSFFGLEKVKP